MVINYPKSILEPCQEVVHLGFLLDLKGGGTQSPLRKVDHLQKGVRKTPHSQRNVLQKDGSYSGAGQILSDSNAFSQGLHSPYAPVCVSSQKPRVGPCANGTPLLQAEVLKIKDLMHQWGAELFKVYALSDFSTQTGQIKSGQAWTPQPTQQSKIFGEKSLCCTSM